MKMSFPPKYSGKGPVRLGEAPFSASRIPPLDTTLKIAPTPTKAPGENWEGALEGTRDESMRGEGSLEVLKVQRSKW
jgi:hypothetical protein